MKEGGALDRAAVPGRVGHTPKRQMGARVAGACACAQRWTGAPGRRARAHDPLLREPTEGGSVITSAPRAPSVGLAGTCGVQRAPCSFWARAGPASSRAAGEQSASFFSFLTAPLSLPIGSQTGLIGGALPSRVDAVACACRRLDFFLLENFTYINNSHVAVRVACHSSRGVLCARSTPTCSPSPRHQSVLGFAPREDALDPVGHGA